MVIAKFGNNSVRIIGKIIGNVNRIMLNFIALPVLEGYTVITIIII